MLRIRLFRVLLPVLLVGMVVLLVWAIQPKPGGRSELAPDVDPIREVNKFTSVGFTFGANGEVIEKFRLNAERTEECGGDCYLFTSVEDFQLGREGQSPLVVSSESAQLTGEYGQRKMRFEGPVRMVDNDLGLVLDLPHLDVDEFTGVGRSSGAIYIEGAGHHTRAERLLYGLGGQATELFQLEIEDDEGALLLAQRAFLHDGIRDVELVQGVRFRRGDDEQRFWADKARVVRSESGRMQRLTGDGNVIAGLGTSGGVAEIAGQHLEAHWSDAGELETLRVQDRALIEQGPQFLSADRIVFTVAPGRSGWDVAASGSVRATGALEDGSGRIRADSLEARFDGADLLLGAEALGDVRFEAPGLRADAAVARTERSEARPDVLQVELLASDDLRARLAQGQTRIAAETIRTDAGGESLTASGRVESTLLPVGNGDAVQGMFRTDKAVHFISNTLETLEGGRNLQFTGNVRGWQGEQNLSAKTVRLDQSAGTLSAAGGVSTRFPRVREEDDAAAGADDYIQVTAATLDYERDGGRAVYREGVRLVFAEGWIESDVLTVTQAEDGSLERLLAEGDVKLEFVGSADDGTIPRTTGNADRLRYEPSNETVRLYGDAKPARIVRSGSQAGTSEGRVLTYRLSDGTLSVEGGTVKAPPPQQEKAPE